MVWFQLFLRVHVLKIRPQGVDVNNKNVFECLDQMREEDWPAHSWLARILQFFGVEDCGLIELFRSVRNSNSRADNAQDEDLRMELFYSLCLSIKLSLAAKVLVLLFIFTNLTHKTRTGSGR